MKVLFAVEAGREFGLGHLLRSRVLMMEFARHGWDLTLWIYGDPSSLDGRDWPEGMVRRHTGSENPAEVWLADMAAHLEQNPHRLVVIDGYHLHGPDVFERIRARGARLVVFDDIADHHLAADALINQNTGHAGLYADAAVPLKLLGPEYALVDEDYGRTPWKIADHRDLARILVVFGGSDRFGWTSRILGWLDEYPGALEIDFVAGPYHAFTPSSPNPRQETRVHRGLTSLAAIMAECDLMITAAGTTVWQACRVGAPFILVQTVDNQREVRATIDDHQAGWILSGSLEYADRPDQVKKEFLALMTEASALEARRVKSDNARSLVDGRGAERIYAAILPFLEDA